MRTFSRYSLFVLLSLLLVPFTALADYVRGIYITQPMMESTKKINHLIKRSKETGINTFVVDIQWKSKRFERNIKLLKQNNIGYVARLVVFDSGGTAKQVASKAHWEKKYRLAEYAVANGAEMIQLDYIRYSTKQRRSPENAENILKVIEFFKKELNKTNTKLQIAIFGEVSVAPSMYIGQNIQKFFKYVDSVAPMNYPSHFYPYVFHSKQPYKTVYDSLISMREQFNNKPPFELYCYIEAANVRYHIPSGAPRANYIFKQIKAVQDSGADGWYVWSANNRYKYLFQALETYKNQIQ